MQIINKQSPFTIRLAMTHEQVSDTLTEGTIDGEIDEVIESTTNYLSMKDLIMSEKLIISRACK